MATRVAVFDFDQTLAATEVTAGDRASLEAAFGGADRVALLREMHGPSAERAKVEHRTFKFNSSTVELTLLSSAHHIELNPSDAGIRDREVVQELIKEIASTAPVLGGGGGGGGAEGSSGSSVGIDRGFKVVVLNEVERLSKPAQHALRRSIGRHGRVCGWRRRPVAGGQEPRGDRAARAELPAPFK